MSVGKRYLYQNNLELINKQSYAQSNQLIILPHQLKIYEYLKSNKSILLFHKMGSGKTISSLYSAIKFGKPTIIIGPKSSKKGS